MEGALATHTEKAVRSAVIGSVRRAAHELLEFIGCGEEMSDILKDIKERFGQGPSKAKLEKEFFLKEQRKTESINQFAEQVEQRFKRLRALYPGRYEIIGSVRRAAHELLEFIGCGEEMSDILKDIKERFGQGPSKAKLEKEFFLKEQRKTESINQFAEQVEQRFKRLRALYPGRYDHNQLKERVF